MTEQHKTVVLCVQDRGNSSILSVSVNGRVVGRVLHDRPGEWIIVKEPEPEPRYPSLEAVVKALLDGKQS